MKLPVSSWAIRRPLVPCVVFFLLLVLGFISYSKLPVRNLPNVILPVVNISIALPGSTSQEMESQITLPVEAAVAHLPGVKHIVSSVRNSVSITEIEFQVGVNAEKALTRVQNQITSIRSSLPSMIEIPVIRSMKVEDERPVLTYVVHANRHTMQDASQFVDQKIKNKLLKIPEITKIIREGGVNHAIRVELDSNKLYAYGISVPMVNEQIRLNLGAFPSGQMTTGEQSMLIRISGVPHDLTELGNLRIGTESGRRVRLKDIATIKDAYENPEEMARWNHQPVVGFSVYRSSDAGEIELTQRVDTLLQELKTVYPDYDVRLVRSSVGFVEQSYNAALIAFLEGAVLAALVVYLFLRSWNAMFIAAVVILLSVVPTFIVMQWLNFSLDTVSLLALSLVAGVLVDDTIVELENIIRYMAENNKTPYQAALVAADEIGLAIVATTAVIVAMFVPVSFMGGVVGVYFYEFGFTVAVATLFSLVVARFITPLMAAYLLDVKNDRCNRFPRWVAKYLQWLDYALAHRKVFILAGIILLVASMILFATLPKDFMPRDDKSQSILQITMSPGTTLARADQTVATVTDLLLKSPSVDYIYSVIGGMTDSALGKDMSQAMIYIQLRPHNERDQDVQTFEHDMLSRLSTVANVRINFLNENNNKDLMISFSSEYPDLLQKTMMQVEKEIRAMPQLAYVSSSTPLPRTDIEVIPYMTEMARQGVNVRDVVNVLRNATTGESDQGSAQMAFQDKRVPVRVLLQSSSLTNPEHLGRLLVPTDRGNLILLSAVAQIKLGSGLDSITRYDRQRQVMIQANLNRVSLGDALDAIGKLPSVRNLPKGVVLNTTGDSELLDEMLGSFTMAMGVGAAVVFIVLSLLFRHVLQSLTIMVVLPLSILGASLALWFTSISVSLPAMIGILMLMGVVGKNGVLLVDLIIEHRNSGVPRYEAIVASCQQRARPIVMTTVAMIAGMLPVVLGLSVGSAFRLPMAIAVIGGLITSTVLSLIFVPIIYIYIDDLELRVMRLLKATASNLPQPEK